MLLREQQPKAAKRRNAGVHTSQATDVLGAHMKCVQAWTLRRIKAHKHNTSSRVSQTRPFHYPLAQQDKHGPTYKSCSFRRRHAMAFSLTPDTASAPSAHGHCSCRMRYAMMGPDTPLTTDSMLGRLHTESGWVSGAVPAEEAALLAEDAGTP